MDTVTKTPQLAHSRNSPKSNGMTKTHASCRRCLRFLVLERQNGSCRIMWNHGRSCKIMPLKMPDFACKCLEMPDFVLWECLKVRDAQKGQERRNIYMFQWMRTKLGKGGTPPFVTRPFSKIWRNIAGTELWAERTLAYREHCHCSARTIKVQLTSDFPKKALITFPLKLAKGTVKKYTFGRPPLINTPRYKQTHTHTHTRTHARASKRHNRKTNTQTLVTSC